MKVRESKMIVSGGYFDGSHDSIIMSRSMIHDSSESFIYDNTNAEAQKFRVTSFSIEDLTNPADAHLTSEPASVVYPLQHHHHLGFDIEQDHSSHMIQEVPPMETANLVSSICGFQDHILSHDIGQGHSMTVQQQILNYDDASYSNGAYNLSGLAIHESGMMFNDPTLPLGYHATQSHLLKDLYHSLPQNYDLLISNDERDGMIGAPGASENIFQEINGGQFDSPTQGRRRQKGGFGKAKGKANFATERERREQLNVKYGALRSLFPNPTKGDRASIVGDAIEYINALNKTMKELKILVEKKRNNTDRRKKLDDEAADDGDSSSVQPVRNDLNDEMHGALKSFWVQKRSKDCEVDVRIVHDEINIKFTENKRTDSLLCATKVLEEFHLDLINVVGGTIGDHHTFMFNTKIPKGSSVFACAVAKKLIEAVEMKNQALDILN